MNAEAEHGVQLRQFIEHVGHQRIELRQHGIRLPAASVAPRKACAYVRCGASSAVS